MQRGGGPQAVGHPWRRSCTDKQWEDYPDKDLVPTHRVRGSGGGGGWVTAAIAPARVLATLSRQRCQHAVQPSAPIVERLQW